MSKIFPRHQGVVPQFFYTPSLESCHPLGVKSGVILQVFGVKSVVIQHVLGDLFNIVHLYCVLADRKLYDLCVGRDSRQLYGQLIMIFVRKSEWLRLID